MTIFEDVVEDQELVIAETRKEIGGSTLLGKAARKMPRSSLARPSDVITEEEPAPEEARSKRRVSSLADSVPGLRFKVTEPAKDVPPERKPQGGLKKDPRRRTIFVPSDDTTMLTIHPGANATDRLDDTFRLPVMPSAGPVDETKLAEERASPKPAARRPRMSLAVAPKRLPLQQMAKERGNVAAVDVPGQNGGKENLPPRSLTSFGEKRPSSRLFAPTAASQAKESVQTRRAVQPSSNPLQRTRPSSAAQERQPDRASIYGKQSHGRPSMQQNEGHQTLRAPNLTNKTTTTSGDGPVARQRHITAPSAPFSKPWLTRPQGTSNKRSSPTQQPKLTEPKATKLHHYAVLAGDLAQPDLYEDDWLRHQEVALTEVINQLFRGNVDNVELWHDANMTLRDRLIDLYHQPNVSTLHQRLQASLRYGALSLPRDASPTLVSQDIGLRRRYINIWLDTYDELLLKDAAQVVIGRQIPEDEGSDSQRSIERKFDPHYSRRGLISFLDTFFVDVQDAMSDVYTGEIRWRKMVSRSLMLIWLLDQAKASHAISGCLFKATSPHKTSTQVLSSLATIVLPSSVGDISRALGHCDYVVSHVQDPLDEVSYKIETLASDMRDGIFLCRLIEILLFRTDHNRLSKHLKMPCLGRAQKLYNVEIALSALSDYGGLRDAVRRITADDVVNGHREKTLSLLWSIVSTYGLEALLDFRELMADIRRQDEALSLPHDQQYLARHQQEDLLQMWAAAICAQHNGSVANLTTSFANGCAYAAIVTAFAPFCGTHQRTGEASSIGSMSHTATSARQSCGSSLRALGCSAAFITSLTSSCTITNRQTTVSNLAFLASRLLPLKRRHNAAVSIQRAFRRRRSKLVASQRVTLMRLAHACAAVVQTQNRLMHAATVLQKAWRSVLAARIERLNEDVDGFQTMARAWLMRRRTQAHARAGDMARVMGGW